MIRRFQTLIIYGLLVGCVPASSLFAQMKIGYVDLEYVVMQMPETKEIQGELQTFQRQLEEKLKIGSKDYPLLQDIHWSDWALQHQYFQELLRLQTEKYQYYLTAQEKVIQKQKELLSPILEKTQIAIREVAIEKGYTYILRNQRVVIQDIQLSQILYAPQTDDLTDAVLQELGISRN